MKAKPKASNPKRVLPLLGALLFFSSLLLLSCDDIKDDDDDDSPKFITVFAGSGTAGFKDGQGTAAQFNNPRGIAVARDGTIYVADTSNQRIRKITPDGTVSTFAGGATPPEFNDSRGIAVTPDGKTIYVPDSGNHRIQKITADGKVETLAGSSEGLVNGKGTAAQFSSLKGIAVAPDGNLYVADSGNNNIRKVTPEGDVTIFAGSDKRYTPGTTDGKGTVARFNVPLGIAVAPDGTIYVGDTTNHLIRKITADGLVSTLAGSDTPGTIFFNGFVDGQGAEAQFYYPQGIAVASDGKTIYVADAGNSSIRKVTADGKVTTIVQYLEKNLTDIALSPDGSTAYITNAYSNQIFKLNLSLAVPISFEITIESPETSVAVGETITLTATSNMGTPTWEVLYVGNGTAPATITSDGVLTGVSPDDEVTVSATVGGYFRRMVVIKVTEP